MINAFGNVAFPEGKAGSRRGWMSHKQKKANRKINRKKDSGHVRERPRITRTDAPPAQNDRWTGRQLAGQGRRCAFSRFSTEATQADGKTVRETYEPNYGLMNRKTDALSNLVTS